MPGKKYHHGDLKNALIAAGIEILAQEGLSGLSLRAVAKRAGVSHSAPYAHFADKQALIAAISTEGFKQLDAALEAAASLYPDDPRQQLVEGTWAYVQFAINNTGVFKLMFSGVLEKELDYPAFIEVSHRTLARVVTAVQAAQADGSLHPSPPELVAAAIWGQVHGLTQLMLEGQFTHTVIDRYTMREIVFFAINLIA